MSAAQSQSNGAQTGGGPTAAGGDPSMEDILASIRRILSEEELPPTMPGEMPGSSVADTPEPDQNLEPDVLLLDTSMLVPDPPRSAANGKVVPPAPAVIHAPPPPPPPIVVPPAEPRFVAKASDAPMPEPAAFGGMEPMQSTEPLLSPGDEPSSFGEADSPSWPAEPEASGGASAPDDGAENEHEPPTRFEFASVEPPMPAPDVPEPPLPDVPAPAAVAKIEPPSSDAAPTGMTDLEPPSPSTAEHPPPVEAQPPPRAQAAVPLPPMPAFPILVPVPRAGQSAPPMPAVMSREAAPWIAAPSKVSAPSPAASPVEPEPIATPAQKPQSETPAMSASLSASAGTPPAGLASAETMTAAASSVTNLVRALTSDRSTQVHSGGPTIADLVREELRPMLKSWLDSNLPPLVERLVRSEIERVISRAAL
jgi:cell pole-organizing protein PopZ